MKLRRLAIVLAGGILLSVNAFANAGTGLMIFSYLHLVWFNAVIGFFEGAALAIVFRLRFFTIGLMILANYFSGFVGYMLVQYVILPLPLDLYTVMPFIRKMVVITFLLSLLLEFPFVCVAFYKRQRWLLKAMCGFLIVQAFSYAILFNYYSRASRVSVITETKLVQPKAMNLPEHVVISFTSSEDGKVRSITLPDLMISESSTPYEPPTEDWPDANVLPSAEASPYLVRAGYYTDEGLKWREKETENQKKSNHFNTENRVALDTPFAGWYVRNVNHLPGDIVAFQLGEDQICLFDLNTRQLALLAKGTRPVAAVVPSSAAATSQPVARGTS